MEEKLIEAMKMHPCLFDKSSSLYRNKYLKDRAWLAVADSTGTSEDNCKTRWKSLRDRFVREKSASKQSSGAAAEEKAEWCFMEAMQFMSKHIAPRKTTSNFDWSGDEPPTCSKELTNAQNENANQTHDMTDLNKSQYSEETPKATKRHRLNTESHERLNRICGTIEAVIAEKKIAPSKNGAFLEILDQYLKKKPEEVQDRLKIEILVLVQNSNRYLQAVLLTLFRRAIRKLTTKILSLTKTNTFVLCLKKTNTF